MKFLLALSALILVVIECVLVFVAQLYSHAILWIISYLVLIILLCVAWRVPRRRNRILIISAASLFINRNFFIFASGTGSGLSLLAWGLLLVAVNIAALYAITEIVRRLAGVPTGPVGDQA